MIKLKSVEYVWNNKNRASVHFIVPCEATPFNGYARQRFETVVVYGQTAQGIIKRAEAEGFSSYSPINSNCIVLTPRATIAWSE